MITQYNVMKKIVALPIAKICEQENLVNINAKFKIVTPDIKRKDLLSVIFITLGVASTIAGMLDNNKDFKTTLITCGILSLTIGVIMPYLKQNIQRAEAIDNINLAQVNV